MSSEGMRDMDEIDGWEPRRHRVRARRVGAAAAAGIGITLGAAGIAAAASSDPAPSPSSGTAAPAAPDAMPRFGPGRRPGGPRGERGMGRGLGGAVHGQFVVPNGTGWRTVAVQRGVVKAVSSTSLTVKSKDGYTKTYVLTAKTLVDAGRDGIATVKKDEKVAVVATLSGETATANEVRDLSKIDAERKQWGPPPGAPGRPAPGGTPASPSSYDDQGGAQPA